jgi:Transglycosylase SLT domain
MSAPRRWARRAVLSALAGGGLTAGLGGSLPGSAIGAEAPAGTASGDGPTPVTTTGPQAPAPAEGASGASETSTTTSTTPSGASPAPAGTSTAPAGSSTAPTGSSTAPTEAAGAPSAAPTVVVQRQQQVTSGRRGNASVTKGSEGAPSPTGTGGQGAGEGAAKNAPGTVLAGTPNGVAPAPQAAGGEASALATLLTGSAVSAQALDFFRIPLFLLPIYKAAAFQYGIPWQVLAAINEVETNYGTDQSVSTAGAVGWMQFMPSTWLGYGVDATDAGYADPSNPADAIFAAARYLHAADASHNLDAAILAYNHSQEYVESVLLRARLIASFPRSVIGTLTGLVDGRTPTPGARVAPGSSGLGVVLGASGTPGSAPAATTAPAPGSALAGSSAAAGSASNGSPSAPGGSASATAGAVPAPTAPTPATAASASASATPGSKPPPPPQVAARRAEAAANAPAKVSQLADLLGAPGAPVVAVENGRIMHLGHSHGLGRYLVLRDIYGDVFTYAGLGSIAHRYRPTVPSLKRARPITSAGPTANGSAQGGSTHSGSTQGGGAGGEPQQDPAPRLPASAGHQPPVTLKVRAHQASAVPPVSAPIESEGETAPPGMGRVRLFAHPDNPIARAAAVRAAKSPAGNGRWLPLRTGSIVSAGTVLGHLDTPAGASAGQLRFAVRPAGDNGTIDPQPLLANWKQLDVALHPEGSSGGNALLGATAGDALLMSKGELERAVLADPGIGLDACGRRDVTAGRVDARVLAALTFLSRSGLQPTVAGLRCPRGGRSPSGLSLPTGADGAAEQVAHNGGTAVDIIAINGVPLAGHQGRGTVADAAIRTLLTLRGRFAPHRIASLMRYPEAPTTQALPSAWDHIGIDFLPSRPATARAATTHGPAASPLAGDLNEAQWSQLIERIAALPKPVVATKPSTTAIRDPQAAPSNRDLGARGLSAGA